MKYYKFKDALKAVKEEGGTLWYDATEKAYIIFAPIIPSKNKYYINLVGGSPSIKRGNK